MRGIFFALCLAAYPAGAETLNLSGSTITLQPTTRPGAVAELVFNNRPTNSTSNERNYTIALDDLSLTFSFDFNAHGQGDEIAARPPEGIICLPTSCVLDVPEYETGTLYLFSAEAVGM